MDGWKMAMKGPEECGWRGGTERQTNMLYLVFPKCQTIALILKLQIKIFQCVCVCVCVCVRVRVVVYNSAEHEVNSGHREVSTKINLSLMCVCTNVKESDMM